MESSGARATPDRALLPPASPLWPSGAVAAAPRARRTTPRREPHAHSCQLGEPLPPLLRTIHGLARRLDPTRAEQRLEPGHHPRAILDETLIRARQSLQVRARSAVMIDRAQRTVAEQIRQLGGIGVIPLVALLRL